MSFEIRFEDSVSIDRSEMRREVIPKRGSAPATVGKSNINARLGDEIEGSRVKLT